MQQRHYNNITVADRERNVSYVTGTNVPEGRCNIKVWQQPFIAIIHDRYTAAGVWVTVWRGRIYQTMIPNGEMTSSNLQRVRGLILAADWTTSSPWTFVPLLLSLHQDTINYTYSLARPFIEHFHSYDIRSLTITEIATYKLSNNSKIRYTVPCLQ